MAYVTEPLFNEPILLTGRVGTLGTVFRIRTPCWPSDNALVVIAKDAAAYEFLYFQMQRIEFSALNRGSTQPLLTQTDLKAQPMVVPPTALLHRFHEVVSSLLSACDQRANQSATLAALRDALLPKLISGELRIADAEKIVGRAT
jgi:type I restriction enzyme S subunit